MKTVAFIIVFCAVVAAFELRTLCRPGLKRDRWAFSLLMLAATGVAVAQALHAPLPSPLHVIFGLFGPVADWADALQAAHDYKPTSPR